MTDWSPDGRFVLYTETGQKSGRDVWALPLDADRTPVAVVQTGFDETGPRFSPDGQWVSYTSNETGRDEIYLQRFPGPGRSWQISTSGGRIAHWRADSREIFYIAPDNRLMAVPVTLNPGTSGVDAGTPAPLFPMPPNSSFDVMRDGRFLINSPRGEATATRPITVVLNWRAE